MLNSVHRDNPTLYDAAGELTEQGKRTMARLDSLTGVRRLRLLEGRWATAEGAVYDMFDTAQHVKERQPTEFVRWALAIDEGYTNPAVVLLVGIDSDGRWHVAKEFYERGRLQEDIVAFVLAWVREYRPAVIAVDAAAAGLIADFRNHSIDARGAKGRVLDGIHTMQDMLKVQGDGRPRLTVAPGCVNTINEFESYAWRPQKDEPLKENDHAMDALRYLSDAETHQGVYYA
jgi:phage terminase large subunit